MMRQCNCIHGLLIALGLAAFAQAVTGTETDRKGVSHFENGQRYERALAHARAAKEFRAAIEANPDEMDAHVAFVSAYRASEGDRMQQTGDLRDAVTKKLIAMYQEWRNRYPRSAAIRWMLGELSVERKDASNGERFYRDALVVDPRFCKAYIGLGRTSALTSNEAAARESYRLAYDCDPHDSAALLAYAGTFRFRESDLPEYRNQVERILATFPGDMAGAKALQGLALAVRDRNERVAIYDRIQALYPPEKDQRVQSLLCVAYEDYLFTDPSRAIAIVNNCHMEPASRYAETLVRAKQLVRERNYADAERVLEGATAPSGAPDAPLVLLRAEAVASTSAAEKPYEMLLEALRDRPDDDLRMAILQYGARLGRSTQQVEAEVWKRRYDKAEAMKDFTLGTYDGGRAITLSNLRGHVVLVNFFFPTCPFCRTEFPHIQEAIEKYRSRGFTVVSINIVPSEDKLVQPMLQTLGLTFTALKPPKEGWARSNYGVEGAPANFLLDRHGRVVFKPTILSSDEARSFDASIEALLAQR